MITITVTQNRDAKGRFMRILEDNAYAALASVIPLVEEEMLRCLGTQYYNLTQLRAMGHPYSRSSPNPPLPPGIINRQTGEFYAGLRVSMPQHSGTRLMLHITSDYWKSNLLMHGTERMVARPYDRQLRQQLNAKVPGAIHKALVTVRTWR